MTRRAVYQSYVFEDPYPPNAWFRAEPLADGDGYAYGRPFVAQCSDGSWSLLQSRTRARGSGFRMLLDFLAGRDGGLAFVRLAKADSKERLELGCHALGIEFEEAPPGRYNSVLAELRTPLF